MCEQCALWSALSKILQKFDKSQSSTTQDSDLAHCLEDEAKETNFQRLSYLPLITKYVNCVNKWHKGRITMNYCADKLFSSYLVLGSNVWASDFGRKQFCMSIFKLRAKDLGIMQ